MNKKARIDRAKKSNRERNWKRDAIANYFAQWWDLLEFSPNFPPQKHDETGYDYYARTMGETLEQWYIKNKNKQ